MSEVRRAVGGLLGQVRSTLRRESMISLLRRAAPARGERVLFWVPGGMPLMLHVEGAIATALRLRGVDVHLVICDGPFTACVRREVKNRRPLQEWSSTCAQCRGATSAFLEELALPHSFIGDYLGEGAVAKARAETAGVSWEDLGAVRYKDLDVGRNARSSIVRYLQGLPLAGHEAIVPEYAASGLLVAEAAEAAFERHQPTHVFMSHAIYVDWGPALQVAFAKQIPVSAWMSSYRPASFYFRNIENTEHIDFHQVSARAWKRIVTGPWSPAADAALDAYMTARYRGGAQTADLRSLGAYATAQGIRDALHLDARPVWGINAHLNWDAVCDYAPMAYPSFDEWIVDTLEVAATVRDVQWLLKVHPVEAWDNPASGTAELVARRMPQLPENVRVISATAQMSPLNFFELVDGTVTVYGTAGLELALLGKPVICAGKAHYGGRGFTLDALDVDTYRSLLKKTATTARLSEEQTNLARRYAHCYFLRRQIPLRIVASDNPYSWAFDSRRRAELLPGRDPYVDFICQRILDGEDFILDEDGGAISP